MTSYLSDHGVWQESYIWRICIQKIINQKFHEAINSPQAVHNKPRKDSHGDKDKSYYSAASSMLGMGFGKIKSSLLGSGKNEEEKQLNEIGINPILDKENPDSKKK